jgi:hypothetical protein
MDGHGATQKAAFAGLVFVIRWFVNHNGFWCYWLSRKPFFFGCVKPAGE